MADVFFAGGKYKFHPVDGINWQLYEYRETKRGKSVGDKYWFPIECYAQVDTFGRIIDKIADKECKEDPNVKDLKSYVEIIEKNRQKFLEESKDSFKEYVEDLKAAIEATDPLNQKKKK